METCKKLLFKVEFENQIILDWSNFIPISEFTKINSKISGVYIWGFNIDSVFIPYYVGIAENIFLRINQHLSLLVSGQYTIFHKSSLTQFKLFKDSEVQTDKSMGKIYSPEWPNNYAKFLINRKELQPHIDYMVDCFQFTYAKVELGENSGFGLKEIEKACINLIGKENLINTKSGNSCILKIEHKGNNKIINALKN